MNNTFIYGTDSKLIERKIDELIKKYEINENSIVRYSLNDSNLDDILEDANTINLFSLKKLIIISDAFIFLDDKKIDTKNLESYLNNYNENCYLIFTLVNKSFNEKSKVSKIIKNKGSIICLNLDNDIERFKYVKNYIIDNNYQISDNDIRYFLSKVGTDFANILNEIDKLFVYKEKSRKILKEDIDNITSKVLFDDMFLFIDYILNKNKNIIDIYNDLVNNGYETIMIIALLASKFRLIYQVKKLDEENISDLEKSKILDVKPYPLKLARNLSYAYSSQELLKILNDLADIDKNIKTGIVNDKVAFELFLLKLIK